MELRSTEKEVFSLVALYQDLYASKITIEKLPPDLLISPLLPSPPISTIVDHVPSWKDLLMQSDCGGDNNDASDNNISNACTAASTDTKYTDDDAKLKYLTTKETLDSFMSFRERVEALLPKIERFTQRLHDTDPVTKAPRYGEKTMTRVKSIVHSHKALLLGMESAFTENNMIKNCSSGVDTVIQILQRSIDDQHKVLKDHLSLEKSQKIAQEQAQREKQEALEREQLLLEEERQAKKQREIEELAQQAELVRQQKLHRLQEEQQARQEQIMADRAFMKSIIKGSDGVRLQLQKLRESCCKIDNKKDHEVATSSLHTIFSQILAHPDNEQFRKIRKSHAGFLNDIGRHEGGIELLIAANFKIVRMEANENDIFFYSREPNIETDMDGWSNWYDGLKKTLELIEEDMLKT